MPGIFKVCFIGHNRLDENGVVKLRECIRLLRESGGIEILNPLALEREDHLKKTILSERQDFERQVLAVKQADLVVVLVDSELLLLYEGVLLGVAHGKGKNCVAFQRSASVEVRDVHAFTCNQTIRGFSQLVPSIEGFANLNGVAH